MKRAIAAVAAAAFGVLLLSGCTGRTGGDGGGDTPAAVPVAATSAPPGTAGGGAKAGHQSAAPDLNAVDADLADAGRLLDQADSQLAEADRSTSEDK